MASEGQGASECRGQRVKGEELARADERVSAVERARVEERAKAEGQTLA